MITDAQGTTVQTLSNILENNIQKMRNSLGSDFSLKAEGVIDNIIVVLGIMQFYLEQQIVYLQKQFDPKTAGGEYQDALYERVGLYRDNATETMFCLNAYGEPNTLVAAENIELKSKLSEDVFLNKESVFDNTGYASITFAALVKGDIKVSGTDEFSVIAKPNNVYSIELSSGSNINIGVERESDAKFRTRFYSKQSKPIKCTRNAVLKNLSEYTGGLKFLSVDDGNSDNLIPSGTVHIVAKPTVTDEEFAKAILDNFIGGVDFIGDTLVSVPLSNGQNWDVCFSKAIAVNFELNINIKIKSGYYPVPTFKQVKENILTYVNEQQYGLSDTVWATEFIEAIAQTDGVEAVTDISVKNEDDADFVEVIKFEYNQYPILSADNIYLTVSN